MSRDSQADAGRKGAPSLTKEKMAYPVPTPDLFSFATEECNEPMHGDSGSAEEYAEG